MKNKSIKVNDLYTACSIAEGFDANHNFSQADFQNAWAYLIKSGQCWKLQGWYGRTAQFLIDNNIISIKGDILKKDQ